MFTWTSRFAVVALVSACATSIPAPDRAELRVEGSRITIVAPAGFCVDKQSVDLTRAGGFLLLSDCALQGWPAVGATSTAVISAAVSKDGLNGSLQQLRAFLTTAPGKVTLGRGGQVNAIRILESRIEDDVLLIKFRDRAVNPGPGQSPNIWRGFFLLDDRMISTSINGTVEPATTDAEASQLLRELAARSRAANG